MYNGPPQQFPHQPHQPHQPHGPGAPVPGQVPPPVPGPDPARRRGGTGRTVAVTVAATLAVYALVVGGAWALTSSSGGSVAGPEFDGLPTDPCSVPAGSELRGVGAVLPSSTFLATSSECRWSAEFSDGTRGAFSVVYRFPVNADGDPERDAARAAETYEEERAGVVDGDAPDYRTIEVLESRTLDLGDESLVSHYLEGSDEPTSIAKVLVRQGDLLIEVAAQEHWEKKTGGADFTGDEETLVAVAERAVAHVG